jgi:hypothetical protein
LPMLAVAPLPSEFARQWAGLCSAFSLGPLIAAHAPVSDLNLSLAVGGHGVPFRRGISIGGYGLSDLIAIRLRDRRFGQQQCNKILIIAGSFRASFDRQHDEQGGQ